MSWLVGAFLFVRYLRARLEGLHLRRLRSEGIATPARWSGAADPWVKPEDEDSGEVGLEGNTRAICVGVTWPGPITGLPGDLPVGLARRGAGDSCRRGRIGLPARAAPVIAVWAEGNRRG